MFVVNGPVALARAACCELTPPTPCHLCHPEKINNSSALSVTGGQTGTRVACDSELVGAYNGSGTKKAKAFLADLPNVAILRECLDYDPHYGLLTWKRRPTSHFSTEASAKSWNSRFVGAAAFTANHGGVKPRHGCITVDGVTHHLEADRVAWTLFYGRPPETPLRFWNGDRSDIRISNLKAVSARDLTLAIPRKGRYLPGAYRDARRGCWWSALHVGDRQIYLGSFGSEEEANAAWLAARARREASVREAELPSAPA